jgi:hypothetical protein
MKKSETVYVTDAKTAKRKIAPQMLGVLRGMAAHFSLRHRLRQPSGGRL